MVDMSTTIGTAAMPIILDQAEADSCENFTSVTSNRIVAMATKHQSSLVLSSAHDYGPMCKKVERVTDEFLNCRVLNPQSQTSEETLSISVESDYLMPDKGKSGESKNISINLNSITQHSVNIKDYSKTVIPTDIVQVEISGIKNGQFFLKSRNDQLLNQSLLKTNPSQIRVKTKESKKEIECFKCNYCPLITLKKTMLDMHHDRQGACTNDLHPLKCPGCDNIVYSNTSLRVHLTTDHNIPAKDVRVLIQNLSRVRVNHSVNSIKSSCAFNGESRVLLAGNATFATPNMHLVLAEEPNTTEVSSCANGKRPSLLETYLDDISNKNNCNTPPRLTQNGADLLENTFNFTAPVSEQLPSIQPENTLTSNGMEQSLIDDSSHLEMESGHLLQSSEEMNLLGQRNGHSNHLETEAVRLEEPSVSQSHLSQASDAQNFLNSFGSRHEETYKDDEQNSYVYIPTDIPVIQLDDKSSHDFDFVAYTEEPPPAAAPASPPLDDKKTAAKKIGCGFRCDINGCKFRMQSDQNIAYHRRCHEGKIYNCPECCKDCPNWISLSSHLWQAHKIDMELYKCDLCPYRTPSYSRLTSIHRGIHGVLRPFLCDICGKGFKTVKQMRNHKNIHKAKMVRMSGCFCDICGRTVADKRLLEQHINSMHKKKKPFLCSICGYAAALKYSLEVHMRKHTGEKPYKCEKCEYRAADHNALRRHRMKHSGARNYKCTQCSYSCIQATTFKTHIKVKHPALESQLIFSCTQCNFQTLQRGKYLSHAAEHGNKMTDFYSDTLEQLRPIMSDPVAETIVDLSGAQSLLEEDYYEVQRITNHLEQPVDSSSLKLKT